MNSILTQSAAKAILLSGLASYCLGFVLRYFAQWSFERKFYDCIHTSCSLGWERMAGKVSLFATRAGASLIITGLIILVAVYILKKR